MVLIFNRLFHVADGQMLVLGPTNDTLLHCAVMTERTLRPDKLRAHHLVTRSLPAVGHGAQPKWETWGWAGGP